MYLPKCQKLALIRKDDFFRNKKKQCLYKRGDHPDCSHTVDNDESDEEPTPPMSAQQGRRYILILWRAVWRKYRCQFYGKTDNVNPTCCLKSSGREKTTNFRHIFEIIILYLSSITYYSLFISLNYNKYFLFLKCVNNNSREGKETYFNSQKRN